MSDNDIAIQVDTNEDASKDGYWYHVLNPNNAEICQAQLVRWCHEYELWDCLVIYAYSADGNENDVTAYLLLEDGTRFSDNIMV